ncbi:MAG: CC_3452 family protein [Sphingomicrobium sp.]
MRSSFFALAALAAGLSAPAIASSYSASLATPASSRIIARDIVWNCGPAACQGATDNSRPVVLCQSLAKQAGRVDAFLVDGRALSADDLAKCNKFAKAAKRTPLAAR